MSHANGPVAIGGGRTIRAATPDDIGLLRRLICEAIDTSPYYNEAFKSHEKARLNESFLLALVSADPWFVTIIAFKGELAGFVMTTPECGVLWASWIYVQPGMRDTAIAIAAVGFLIRHWDNGRFHKVSCFVRPENERSVAVMTHFGFAQTARLQTHLFGQDYLLLERPFNRAEERYDGPVGKGRLALVRLRLRHRLGKWITPPGEGR